MLLTTTDLERALADAGLAAPVRADEVTGSTNASALAMAEGGAPEWTLVAAGHQTAGRGRLGRAWADREGDALLFSFVLRPVLPPDRAGLLTLLAGATAVEAARERGADVGAKWPNDLRTPAGKAGGILVETSVAGGALRHAVVGVGINLGEAPDVEGAASLGPIDAADLLTGFLAAFRSRYDPTDPRFAERVLAAARATSITIGREVEARRADGSVIRGTAVDLDAAGGLVVETTDGHGVVAFGEIAHLTR